MDQRKNNPEIDALMKRIFALKPTQRRGYICPGCNFKSVGLPLAGRFGRPQCWTYDTPDGTARQIQCFNCNADVPP